MKRRPKAYRDGTGGDVTSFAFRGYLIRRNPLNGSMWIEKDGAHIGSCLHWQDGQRIIKELVP